MNRSFCFMIHMMNNELYFFSMRRLISNYWISLCGRLFVNRVIHWHILEYSAHIFRSTDVSFYCLIRLSIPINCIVKCFSFLQHFLSSVDLKLNFVSVWWVNWREHIYNFLMLQLSLLSIPVICYNIVNLIEDFGIHFLLKDCRIHFYICLCSCIHNVSLQLISSIIMTSFSFLVNVMSNV